MSNGRMRRVTTATLVVLVMAGLVGWAATSLHGGSSSSSSTTAVRTKPSSAEGATSAAPGEPVPPGRSSSGSGSGASFGTVDSTGSSSVPEVGPKVVKDASITLSVKKGSFADRFQQAIAIAGANGGFVESSGTSVGKYRSGVVTIRVPVDRFESALAQLKGLGTVRDAKVSGQDVTSQYVDLQARLTNWKAQEAVLLRLMSKAVTITDSLRVEQQLQDVQGMIEELQGQLLLLNNQTAMSTITVSMAEAAPVHPAPAKRPALVQAWHDGLDGFVNVLASVVVGLGYLIPLGMLALVGWLGWRGVRRVQRHGPAPAATAGGRC